jgi:pentatricopeptide repeat protein
LVALTALFSDMLSASCAPTTATFSTLIQACGKARLDTKLLEIFDQIKDYDLKPNDEVDLLSSLLPDLHKLTPPKVFASMIMAFGHLGNFEEALRYFFAVEQAGLQQNELTYAAIITAA